MPLLLIQQQQQLLLLLLQLLLHVIHYTHQTRTSACEVTTMTWTAEQSSCDAGDERIIAGHRRRPLAPEKMCRHLSSVVAQTRLLQQQQQQLLLLVKAQRYGLHVSRPQPCSSLRPNTDLISSLRSLSRCWSHSFGLGWKCASLWLILLW